MIKGLIVSCQAIKGEPLYGHHVMGVMARAAVMGGADAIRTSSVEDIADIKKNVSVPIIGLIKRCYGDNPVYITPCIREVQELIDSGCDIIAIDATSRARPNGERLEDIVSYARHNAPNIPLMADIATTEEAINADKLGFDIISTTLRGYTDDTMNVKIPDYSMIKQVVKSVSKPVVAEGGIWETRQLKKILKLGVSSVVIGTAITRPKEITQRFKKVFTK